MTSITPTGKLVLAVDDEPMILRSTTTALAMAGYMAIVAENGVAGLEAFTRMPNEIDLVLADIFMPFMSGLQMAERIRAIRADVPIILMTAYSDSVIKLASGIRLPLIRKPFLPDDLVRAVDAAIHPPTATA